MKRTISVTAEFEADIRGELTEKKMIDLMRNGDTRCKNPRITEVTVDGTPNEEFTQLLMKELLEQL